MLKQQALNKIVELEELLHQEQNSTEYWISEYNQLYEIHNKVSDSKDPILEKLEKLGKLSIIQEQKILDFIDNLTVL